PAEERAVNRFDHDERGVALITALLAVLILGGLSVVFVNRATTESRASSVSQNHETAIHTSEAAADVVIAQLNLSSDYVTLDRSSAEVPAPSATTDVRVWARDLVEEMRETPTWVEGDAGESFAVRPVADGE